MEEKLEGATGEASKESFVDLDIKSVAQSVAAKSVAKSVAPS